MHSRESLARMTAHKKPGAFLRALLLHLDGEENLWFWLEPDSRDPPTQA
jgi:hypothetical protein